MTSLCPICGDQSVMDLMAVEDPVTRRSFRIVRCSKCGLGFTVSPPENLAEYYRGYHGNRHSFTVRFCDARRIRLLTAAAGTRSGRRLLDVGCGQGTFLERARREGWAVMGSEMHPEPARQNGLKVVADLGEIPERTQFDCVTAWHSLEHMRNPLGTLHRLRRLLVNDGVLIVAVPDAGGMQASLFGREWLHLDVPRHLFHFRQASLAELLNRSGFKPLRWWHQEFEYDLMGWSQSALNKLMKPPNLFFDMLTGRPVTASRSRRYLHWMLGALLCGLATPLVPFSSAFGRGGTLIVAARPQ